MTGEGAFARGMTSKLEYPTIAVKYRYVDGYHVFTSEDVRGLHVASKDAKKAFDSVSEVLQELLSHMMKQKGVVVVPTAPFEEWMKRREAGAPSHPPFLGNRNFVIKLDDAA